MHNYQHLTLSKRGQSKVYLFGIGSCLIEIPPTDKILKAENKELFTYLENFIFYQFFISKLQV